MHPEGHPQEKVCGSQEVRWGGREAAGPGRFAVPLRGPSRWLFLATGDGQIPLREEKQSRRSCRPQAEGLGMGGGGGRAGRADVFLALTLTRAEACGAANRGGGPHPLRRGSAGVLGVPAALPVAPRPVGTPSAAWPALLGLPRSVAVGSVAPSPPPAQGRGGSPAAPGCSAAPPATALAPAPRSEPPSDRGSCRDEVTPARRPSPRGARALPARRRAAMWHRPSEGLPSNKGVHPWPEPNPHAPGLLPNQPAPSAAGPGRVPGGWQGQRRSTGAELQGATCPGRALTPAGRVHREPRQKTSEDLGEGGGVLSRGAPLPAGSPLSAHGRGAPGGRLKGTVCSAGQRAVFPCASSAAPKHGPPSPAPLRAGHVGWGQALCPPLWQQSAPPQGLPGSGVGWG